MELSNLQRQSLYTEKDLGKAKAISAKEHLQEINKEVKIKSYVLDLAMNVSLLKNADLILDGTDNLRTRLLINDYARKNKIPWIYAAVVSDKGMVMDILPKDNYCFHCVFSEAEGLETCDTSGILNTAVHFVVSIQVTEALKILTNQKTIPGILKFDVWKGDIEKFSVKRSKNCETCNGGYPFLKSNGERIVSFCGSNQYQIIGDFNYEKLKKRLKKLGKVVEDDYCFKWRNFTVFKNRVLIKAKKKEEAKILYSKYVGD